MGPFPFNLVNYKEDKILRGCLKRDRKAQYVFYKHHFAYLFSICLRYASSREEAMEMLNLSFARIMLNLDKYNKEQALKTWIRSITVNCIIDEFRKQKRYKENIAIGTDIVEEYRMENSEHLRIGSNLLEVIQDKLTELHPMTRSVFNLYAIDGYKHREIAELLKISEGTSAWHYSVARKALKEFLQPELEHLTKNGKASA